MKRKLNRVAIIFLLTVLGACNTDKSAELKSAWLKNDKKFIVNYLNTLEKLEANDFYRELVYLNNSFNFSYGVIDYKDVNKWTDAEKKYSKQNILIVYRLYIESCLFDEKNIGNEQRDSIHYFFNELYGDKFYRVAFSNDEIQAFKFKMESFCKR